MSATWYAREEKTDPLPLLAPLGIISDARHQFPFLLIGENVGILVDIKEESRIYLDLLMTLY